VNAPTRAAASSREVTRERKRKACEPRRAGGTAAEVHSADAVALVTEEEEAAAAQRAAAVTANTGGAVGPRERAAARGLAALVRAPPAPPALRRAHAAAEVVVAAPAPAPALAPTPVAARTTLTASAASDDTTWLFLEEERTALPLVRVVQLLRELTWQKTEEAYAELLDASRALAHLAGALGDVDAGDSPQVRFERRVRPALMLALAHRELIMDGLEALHDSTVVLAQAEEFLEQQSAQ
jgi:hypothetical protein